MRFIFIAAQLAFLASFACGADDENPFRNAKVGDWAEYKMTGAGVAGTTRMSITAKTDQQVTYEVTSKFTAFGQETVGPVQSIKVDLAKQYDAVVAANQPQNKVKTEKIGEGTEKLKVGGKEIETKWTKVKCTTTVNDISVVTDNQMWFSKEVPISGMVKMETNTMGTITKVELVASGSK